MTNKKTTKRALIASVVSLLLCFTMLLGTTYAWFTDNVTSVNNIITSGNLDVELYYQNSETSDWTEMTSTSNVFLEDTLWEPGHAEVVYLKIVNEGSLALKYQLSINVASEKAGTNVDGKEFLLSDYIRYAAALDLEKKFDNRDDALKAVADAPETYLNQAFVKKDIALEAGEEKTLALVVYMPTTVGNEANYKTDTDAPYINLGINVLATQYTFEEDSFGDDYDKDAEYWDKTADTSWYDSDATVYELTSPNQMAGLQVLVDDGETFEGKTVKLATDIDLEGKLFDPIGSYRKELAFKGTFDGQGHTISNLSQNTWELNNGYYYGDLGLGLFGLVEDATIKNLTVDGAEISGESAIVGIVAGCAYGDMVFENITVKNSQGADYQYYAGGIVGWASGSHQYIGCVVDETTTIGSQWGDFGNANGGLIGGIGSTTEILFKDCVVSCRIDAVNDVVSAYRWYNYRNSGMLIGRVPQTITNGESQTVKTPENVTCENVTVNYGEWANYTYCEFAGTGYPYVRVQAGTSVDAYSNVRYGHPTDANGNLVVDDNHVHNEGEDHQVVIAFDQLFGGPANHRYCYYGIATYPGVAVIYPTTVETFNAAFELDNGNGDKTDIKDKINTVVFGKTSEYPDIVSNNTPISNEKGIATYQVANGTTYDIYYLSENKIMMPEDCTLLFKDLKNMTTFDASNLDMSQVKSAYGMFGYCSKLKTIEGAGDWDMSNVETVFCMFSDCYALESLDTENWDMSNVTNMQSMFYKCNNLQDIDVSKWDTSNVTNMRMVFFRCNKLSDEVLKGVENWDVSNVTNFYSMFKHAYGVTTLDLSKWDTSNATNMSHMFANIGDNLTELDLSGFDTSNVTDMSWMFYDASKLTTVVVGDGWTTEALDPANSTCFYNNQALVGGEGTTWLDVCDMANAARPWESSAKLDYAIVDGGTANPGLLTYKASN